jgi:RHS repeat-associated protein
VDSLTWTYDSYGNPVTEKGYDTYVSDAVWTPYNEISQIDLGTGASAASLSYTYQPQTRAVTSVNLSDNQPSPQVDNTQYNYNADQQITSIVDTQGAAGSAPVETQCFDYDGLSRLKEAWTSTDSCATDPDTADSNATVGGPQPYWESWSFDPVGDITVQDDNAPAGSSAGNTVIDYNYGDPGHAHAVASVDTSNTTTGTSTTTTFGYDADGNMNNDNGTSLTWNYNGTLASDGSDTYVYDADGNELAETNSSGTTLFLPGEELTLSGSTTTGVRYYTFGSATIAEDTGSTLYWTESNLQGTLTAVVDAFDESEPAIYRTTTPYGQMVTTSGAPAWPDNRTLLNDYTSPDTGLVDVGARKFDPALDIFISVDPVLNAAEPQTMTGYTYAADDPINASDPTGEYFCMSGGTCGGLDYMEHTHAQSTDAPIPGSDSNPYPTPSGYYYDPYATDWSGSGSSGGSAYNPRAGEHIVKVSVKLQHSLGHQAGGSPDVCSGSDASMPSFMAASLGCYPKAIPRGGSVVGPWIWNHRGTLATAGALVVCFGVVSSAACGIAQALAYAVRAQQREEDEGFSASLAPNTVDLIFTVTSFGTAEVASSQVEEMLGASWAAKDAAAEAEAAANADEEEETELSPWGQFKQQVGQWSQQAGRQSQLLLFRSLFTLQDDADITGDLVSQKPNPYYP